MAEKKYTVLVLCTGNSCRSQMAEVLLNHDLAGQVRALSAGTRPQPKVADGAIAALQQAGLPTDGLHPKDIDAVMNEDIDLVVTVCDNAKEACPDLPEADPGHPPAVPRSARRAAGELHYGARRHPHPSGCRGTREVRPAGRCLKRRPCHG